MKVAAIDILPSIVSDVTTDPEPAMYFHVYENYSIQLASQNAPPLPRNGIHASDVTPASRKPPTNTGLRPTCVMSRDVRMKAGISTRPDRNAFQKMSPLSVLVLSEKP